MGRDFTMMELRRVHELANSVFRMGERSPHGPAHWQRVEEVGLRLAKRGGADSVVVRLFAMLHDCRRENDGRDPDHGRRAAEFARSLRGKVFQLADARFALLERALALHADGEVTADETIGTCWDADRLDLPRVGIEPLADMLSTNAARSLLLTVRRRGAGNHVHRDR